MAHHSIPPRSGEPQRRVHIYTPWIRASYTVVSLAAVLMFLGGFVVLWLGDRAAGFQGYGGISLGLGLIGIVGSFFLFSLDFALLGFQVMRRWPRQAARVRSVEILPYDLGHTGMQSGDHAPKFKIEAKIAEAGSDRVRDLIASPQSGWDTREEAERYLAQRIVAGRCEVAIEPDENGRAFLLPWPAGWGAVVTFGLIFLAVVAAMIVYGFPYAKRIAKAGITPTPARREVRAIPSPSVKAPPIIVPGPRFESDYPIAHTLFWRIDTEGDVPVQVSVSAHFIKKVGASDREKSVRYFSIGKFDVPARVPVGLPTDLDGVVSLNVDAEGFARPHTYCFVAGSQQEGGPSLRATVFRKRYAVLRYAIGPAGSRMFSPAMEKVTAAAAFRRFSEFRTWDFWQGPVAPGDTRAGSELVIRSYFTEAGAGVRREPEGTSFEGLVEAPEEGYLRDTFPLRPGLVFTARGKTANGFVYGKFLIEQVTTDPPATLPKY